MSQERQVAQEGGGHPGGQPDGAAGAETTPPDPAGQASASAELQAALRDLAAARDQLATERQIAADRRDRFEARLESLELQLAREKLVSAQRKQALVQARAELARPEARLILGVPRRLGRIGSSLLATVRGTRDREGKAPAIPPAAPLAAGAAMIEAPGRARLSAADAFRQRLAGATATPPTGPPLSVAILADPTTDGDEGPGRLRTAMEAAGLSADVLDAADPGRSWDPSVLVAVVCTPRARRQTLPRDVVSVALIADAPESWLEDPGFDDHDLVIVADEMIAATIRASSSKDPHHLDLGQPDRLAAALRDLLHAWALASKVAVQIAPATWEAAATWGDTHFARGLQRAFERLGWYASVHVAADADAGPAVRADVALHLFGLSAPPVRPGQLSILWVISHPDRVRATTARQYDLVFAASDTFAAELAMRLDRPVEPLLQATDPARFHPDPGGPRHELLFIGNSRNARRPILDALQGTDHDLAVYGGGWKPDLLDPAYLRGTWIPNADLHRYYSGADIVLNDHWADMRQEGFISNRVFDALASGAFVLSDRVPGMSEHLAGGLATYASPADLRTLVDHYLAHPAERRARAELGRAAVLARHTFDHRIATIVEAVDARRAGSRG